MILIRYSIFVDSNDISNFKEDYFLVNDIAKIYAGYIYLTDHNIVTDFNQEYKITTHYLDYDGDITNYCIIIKSNENNVENNKIKIKKLLIEYYLNKLNDIKNNIDKTIKIMNMKL